MNRYDALQDGLEWGGGLLKGFVDEAEAAQDWQDKSATTPSRIVELPSPGYF